MEEDELLEGLLEGLQVGAINKATTDPEKGAIENKDVSLDSQLDSLFDEKELSGASDYIQGQDAEEYDFTMKSGGFDHNLHRADLQSWTEQLAKGLGKAALKIIPEIIGSTASLLDFEDYINQDNEVGNSVVRAMNELKGRVDEALPIHAMRPGTSLDVGDFAWWAENGSGLLTSAAAFAATGMGVGAVVSKGTQALKWLAYAKGGRKAYKAVAGAEGAIGALSTSLALNQAESILSAVDIYDETLKASMQNGISMAESEENAASAAAHVINVNRANVALNLTSGSAFLANKGRGFSRYMLKKESLLKKMGAEGAQEYAEEVINLYAENRGRIKGEALAKKEAFEKENFLTGVINTAFTIEGLEAGLLGAVGGMAQTGFTGIGNSIGGEKSKNAQLQARISEQQKAIINLDNSFKDDNRANYTTALTGAYDVAQAIEKRDNLLEVATKTYTDKGLEIPTSLIVEIENETDLILATQSVAAFEQGLGEQLEGHYKDIASMSSEEAAKKGFSGEQLNEKSPQHYKKSADKALAKIAKYEEIYNENYIMENPMEITANRIEAENTNKANQVLATDVQTAKANISQDMPLWGLPVAIEPEFFEEIYNRVPTSEEDKKLHKRQKNYISRTKKNVAIKNFLEKSALYTKGVEEAIAQEEDYAKLTSYVYQRDLHQAQAQKQEDSNRKEEKKELKAKQGAEITEMVSSATEEGPVISEISETPSPDVSVTETASPNVIVESLTIEEKELQEELGLGDNPIEALNKELNEEIKENKEKTILINKEVLGDIQAGVKLGEDTDHQESDNKIVVEEVKTLVEALTSISNKAPKTNALAYLSREKDENNKDINDDLNPTANHNVLDFNKVNVGIAITLISAEDYTGKIFVDGIEVSWDAYKQTATDNNIIEYMPMPIKGNNGEVLAYVHTVEWINEKNTGFTGEELENEKNKIRAIRKGILAAGEAGINTEITSRTNGVLFRASDTKPLSESMPGVKLTVVKNGNISSHKDLNIINKDEYIVKAKNYLKEGFTMALLPVNKAGKEIQYLAAPMRRQRIRNESITAIKQAVKLYMDIENKITSGALSTDEANRIASEIEASSGYDIKTTAGLDNYIRLFTNTTGFGTEKGSNIYTYLAVQAETANEFEKRALNVGKQGLAFGKSGVVTTEVGQATKVFTPQHYKTSPDAFLTALESFLKESYAHVDINLMETKVGVPLISPEGVITELFNGRYEEYISIYNLQTNLRSKEIGTEEAPKRTYTIQPVISFDDSFVGVTETINQDSATTKTTPVDNVVKPTEETPNSNEKVEKKSRFSGKPKFTPGKGKEEGDFLLSTAAIQPIDSSYHVSKLTSKQQSVIVTNLTVSILEEAAEKNLDEEGETKAIKAILDDTIADYIENVSPELQDEAWKLRELTRIKLQEFLQVSVSKDRVQEEANNINLENPDASLEEDKDRIWGEDILTVNPKSSLSIRLKRTFAFTPAVKDNGELLIEKSTGMQEYVDPDEAYTTVMGILAEDFQGKKRTAALFSDMMKQLLEAKNTHTFLPQLVKKLETSTSQIKNEFVTTANKHHIKMNFVKTVSTDKGPSFLVWDENANSRIQVIKGKWRNNNVSQSPLSSDLMPEMDVAKQLQDTFTKWKTALTPIAGKVLPDNLEEVVPRAEVEAWLKDMGLVITPSTMEAFFSQNKPVGDIAYHNHFLSKSGIFYNLNEGLKKLNSEQELLESALYTDNAVTKLAAIESANNPLFTSNSFRAGKNTIFAQSQNKYASTRSADLLYDVKALTIAAKDPTKKYLPWLRSLVKTDPNTDKILFDDNGDIQINFDSYFHDTFNFEYLSLSALQEENSFLGANDDLGSLTAAKHEKVKQGLFWNKLISNSAKKRAVRFFFPSMSDKSAMFTIKAVAEEIRLEETGELKNTSISKIYKAAVLPEIMRMTVDSFDDINVADFEQGRQIFYSIPELNDLDSIWEIAGSSRVLKKAVSQEGSPLNVLLMEEVEKHLNKVVDKQVEDWTELDTFSIDNTYKKHLENNTTKRNTEAETTTAQKRLAAADYAMNYFIANANFNQLYGHDTANYFKAPKFSTNKIIGGQLVEKEGQKIPLEHPNYYKEAVKTTLVNFGKRMALLAAPGVSPAIVDDKTTYKQGMLVDKKGMSLSIDAIEDLFGKNSSQVRDYKNIETTDAQEWITVEEKLITMFGMGELSEKSYRSLLTKALANEDFTKEDLIEMKVFQPDKPLYTGTIKEGISERMVYIKSSSVTLVPQFTRGLEIDNLRLAMESPNGVARIAFGSAVKTGNVLEENQLNIWNEDGTIKDSKEIIFTNTNTLELNRADFKIQQKVPYKESETINRVSQASKLAFLNILDIDGFSSTKGDGKRVNGAKLREEYLGYWETMYNSTMSELMTELGIDTSLENWVPDAVKLEAVIKQEAELRGYSLQDIEGLEMREDGSFEMPLWAQGAASQYEALLSSLVANKIIKQKMPGKSYVLASEEGIKVDDTLMTLEEAKEKGFVTDNLLGIVFTKAFNKELQPANHLKGKMNNQIIIPWPFKGVDMQDYVIDGQLDMSKIDPSLLKRYGMRIPNQGPSSTANLEIVGFLPVAMGDIIIAPRDFITQMGSDFDIDKLYTYAYNYITDGEGNLKRIKEETFDRITLEAELKKYKTRELAIHKKSTDKITSADKIKRKEAVKKLSIQITNLEELLSEYGLTKALAQDGILATHRSINSNTNKTIQKQIREPLGFGDLSTLAARVEKARESKDAFLSPYSSIYQRTKYRNGSSGKTAISRFALANNFNALAQVSGTEGHLFLNVDKAKTKPLKVFFGNEVNKTGDLSQVTTLNGKSTIADTFNALLSSAVDNEKEQNLHRLNINDYTYSVISLLAQMGFSQQTIVGFTSQDIIFDYITRIDHHRNKGKNLKEAQKAAIDVLEMEQYKVSEGIIQDEVAANIQADLVKKSGNIGPEALFTMIEGGISTPRYQPTQEALLNKFIFLQDKVKDYSTLVRTANIDSSGMGKNLFESKTKEQAVVDVLNNSKITSASRIFGIVTNAPADDSYIQMGKVFLKPTTLAGFATVKGVLTNNKIWNQPKYFPYTSKSIGDAIIRIKKFSNLSEFDAASNAEIEKRIFNGMKSYYFSQLDNLGLVDNKLIPETAVLARIKLLENNNSLTTLIGKAVKDVDPYFTKNAFLNKLSLIYRRAGAPASIRFDHRIEDADSKMNVTVAMINMLNSTEALPERLQIKKEGLSILTAKDLATALITSQYASGGIQQHTQFLKYIPLDYLKKIGFTEKTRNEDFRDLLNEGAQDGSMSHFEIQYFQHNTKLIPTIETSSIVEIDKETDLTALSEFTLTDEFLSSNEPELMVKIETKEKSIPFLYNGTSYIRVDTLGGVDLKEYQRGMTTRSMVYNNQAREVPYYKQKAANTRAASIQDKSKKVRNNRLKAKYGFENTETASITKTLEAIVIGGPKEYQVLAEEYLVAFTKFKKPYKLEIDNTLKAVGQHQLPTNGNPGVIRINPTELSKMKGEANYALAFLHEITHLLTVDTLNNPITEEQKKASSSLKRLFKAYRATVGEKRLSAFEAKRKANKEPLSDEEIAEIYPATNVKEFVASFMTNSQTRAYLNKVAFNEEESYGDVYKKRLLKILKSKGVENTETTTFSKALESTLALIDSNPTKGAEVINASMNPLLDTITIKVQKPTSKSQRESAPFTKEAPIIGKEISLVEFEENFEIEAELVAVPTGFVPFFNEYDIENSIEASINNIEEENKKTPGLDMGELGDLLPLTTNTVKIDKSIKNPLITAKQNNLKELSRKLARRKGQLKNTKNVATAVAIENSIIKLNASMQELKEEIAEINKFNAYADLLEVGLKDIAAVDDLLAQNIVQISPEDLLIAERTLNTWEKFRKSEITKKSDPDETYKTELLAIQNQVEDLKEILYDVQVEKTKNYIRKTLGASTTEERISKITYAIDDISFLGGTTLDLSKTDNVLLQAISKSIQVSVNNTAEELALLADKVDPLIKAVEKSFKVSGKDWTIFQQSDSDSKKTGRITTLYTQSYTEERKRREEKAFGVEGNPAAIKDFYEWKKNNEIIIDPSKLDNATYLSTISKEVGNEGLAVIKKKVAERVAYYENARDRQEERINSNPILTVEEKKVELEIWEVQNNPNTFNKGAKDIVGTTVWPTAKYMISVPKRVNSKGNTTEFYDSNFADIKNDPALSAFHDYLIDILSTIKDDLPENRTAVNTIPLMQKDFLQSAKGLSGNELLNLFGDAIKQIPAGKNIGSNYVIDELTEGRMLSPNFNRLIEKKKQDRLDLKVIQYEQKIGTTPAAAIQKEWRKEIADELVKESSPDLGAAIKTYAAAAIAYKHKSKVQTPIRMAEQVFNRVEEIQKGSTNKPLADEDGIITTQGNDTYKSMLDSALNKFFGKPKKIEGSFGKAIFNKEDAALKEELETAITNSKSITEEINSNKELEEEDKATKIKEEEEKQRKLQTRADNLGVMRSATSIIGRVQAYTQLLGMGWNVMAGIANFGFGQITNTIEGAGGGSYSVGQYFAALGKSLNSLSLLGLQTAEGKKISILMKRWNILSLSSQEIFKVKTAKSKLLNTLNPYKIQDSTEYLNQAPLMLLYQQKTELRDAEGNPILDNSGKPFNWYNSYNNKGEWVVPGYDEASFQTQKENLIIEIKTMIRQNHGNYDSEGASTKIKDTTVGRLLAQYRSWMFEGFASRFEGEYQDNILGVIKKGRYITLWEQKLGLKMMKKGGYDNLSAIDKQNFKKALMEISILASTFISIAILKGMKEDEEDEEKLGYLNILVNLGLRMNTDILFYTSPTDFEHLTKSTIPAVALIPNAFKWFEDIGQYILGDEDNRTIKTGVYSGESKLMRSTSKMFPFLTSVQKVEATYKQTFDKR